MACSTGLTSSPGPSACWFSVPPVAASSPLGLGTPLSSEWGVHSDGLRPFTAFVSSWGCTHDPTVFAAFRAMFSEDQEGMDSGERGQGTQGLVLATSPGKREKQTAGIPRLHSPHLPPRTSAPVILEDTEQQPGHWHVALSFHPSLQPGRQPVHQRLVFF